jgi:hypothetical protein
MSDAMDPQEQLLAALEGKIGLDAKTSAAAGQPTAEVTISRKPLIKFKIYTKPVTDRFGPGPHRRPRTYFWADIYVGGRWLDPNTSWANDPDEAMKEALQWWARSLVESTPYVADLFKGARRHYDQGYGHRWLIEGTLPEEVELA